MSRAALPAAVTVLFWVAAPAHADTGILDNIAGSYKTASGSWAATLLVNANRLFMLLATIELAWSFAAWVLDKNELQSFMAAVTKKIMWIGVFYALLLYGPVWVPAIIDSFSQAGATAGGASGLSPSEVFTTGLDDAATMLAGIQKLSLLDDAATIILCGLAAIVIVLAFAVIAGQLLVALVESYIAISAGLLFLGFGGSRWTTDFVQKYIGYAVATGVKLFMLYLIIGIGNTQAATWKTMLATIGTPGVAVFNIVLTVMGGAVMLAYLAFQIPSMAAAMLAGSPALTAGAAAASAATLGAGIVGVGAAGAASTLGAAKSMGGLGSAAGAAFKLAGEQGALGASRAVGTLGNMASAAVQDSGNRLAQAIAPTKGGRMADISRAGAAERSAANEAVVQPPAPPSPRPPKPPKAPSPEPEVPATAKASAESSAPTPAGQETSASGNQNASNEPSGVEGTESIASAPATAADASSPSQSSSGSAGKNASQAPTSASSTVTVQAASDSPGASALNAMPDTLAKEVPLSIASADASTPDRAAFTNGAPASTANSEPMVTKSNKPGTTAISSATPPDGDFAALISSLSSPLPQADASLPSKAAGPTLVVPTAPPAQATEAAQTAQPDAAGEPPPPPEKEEPAKKVPAQAAPDSSAPISRAAVVQSAPAAASPLAPVSKARVQAQPQHSERGLEAALRSLQQIRAPQIPSDAAPPATVTIRFDAPQD